MLALKSWHSLLDLQRSPNNVLASPCIHALVHIATNPNLPPLLPAFLLSLFSYYFFIHTRLFLHPSDLSAQTESNHHLSPMLLLQFVQTTNISSSDYLSVLQLATTGSFWKWKSDGVLIPLKNPAKTSLFRAKATFTIRFCKVPPDLTLSILWTYLYHFPLTPLHLHNIF